MLDLAISVAVAGCASLITFLVGVGSRRLRDKRLGRKYPVAGRFVTEYEDSEDGARVTRKALTTLKQRGRHVTGETVEFEEGRSWVLSGTVEPGGFIHGIYGAEDPHDTGTGTFFLKVAGRGGDLEGLWAGYDSVNGGLDGGRYSFRRCPDVVVREAQPADARRVCALLGDALGELYVELDALHKTITGDSETCFIAVSNENHLLGAVTVGIVDSENLGSTFPVGQQAVAGHLRIARYRDHLGLIKSIAVDPKGRRRGVATQLVERSIGWLAERDASGAVCVGWKSEKGCHVAGVMEITGFEPIEEVADFWLEESRQERYSCPSCGEECRCAAVIFTRALDVSDTTYKLAATA